MQPRALAFLIRPGRPSLLSRQFLQQLLPHNRYIVRRIRADPDLVAFDFQHRDFDLFAGRGFVDEGFAWVPILTWWRVSTSRDPVTRSAPLRCNLSLVLRCDQIENVYQMCTRYIGGF